MFVRENSNPVGRMVGDCAIRAVAKALDTDWESAYAKLCLNGYSMGNLPNSNEVIASVMREGGFYRKNIPNTCPDCYTIGEFMEDNHEGVFLLGTGDHVATIRDGDLYDTFDSSDFVPVYVWYKTVEPRFRERS
jgi:hypothetical protein